MYRARGTFESGSDEFFMQEALRLAHGGLGWASPNPVVGCVLVRDGSIIGRGFHAKDGGPHAEAEALRQAGDARGATCYVSLEPCSHEGRQPSCCRLLTKAGVARVVYGVDDADPRTAGKAAGLFGESGIVCESGVLADECRRLLDYYLHSRQNSSPFVHLKLAVSLDAKLACGNGASQWLSGPQSLGFAHYLRQKYDAIMVGSGTVLADNPRLTTRPEVLDHYMPRSEQPPLKHPCRVVFDPRGEVLREERPLALAALEGEFPEQLPRLIVVTAEQPPADSWLAREAELVIVPSGENGRVKLGLVFSKLWNLGIKSLVIEGGARLARELLRQDSANRLSLVITPKLIGSDGLEFAPRLGLESLEGCIELTRPVTRQLGPDTLIDGYLK